MIRLIRPFLNHHQDARTSPTRFLSTTGNGTRNHVATILGAAEVEGSTVTAELTIILGVQISAH